MVQRNSMQNGVLCSSAILTKMRIPGLLSLTCTYVYSVPTTSAELHLSGANRAFHSPSLKLWPQSSRRIFPEGNIQQSAHSVAHKPQNYSVSQNQRLKKQLLESVLILSEKTDPRHPLLIEAITSTTAKPLIGRDSSGWLSRDVTVYMDPTSDTDAVSTLSSGSPRLPRLPRLPVLQWERSKLSWLETTCGSSNPGGMASSSPA